MADPSGRPPARTVLEQKIRERNQTLEEFIDYVEKFRRDHNEPGTLSLRHLERLLAGHRGDGRPLGPLRPATARLLERIFALDIDQLLAPLAQCEIDAIAEFLQRLSAARRVDATVTRLFREQLDTLRRLDRQMGAIVAYREVLTKTTQIETLMSYSLSPSVRTSLASILAELRALAGWEALDLRDIAQAWEHHERAKLAAREAGFPSLYAHSLAQQALVLTDIGEGVAAVDQLSEARNVARRAAPALLRSWLAAAHGEGLAAVGRRTEALRAFDAASSLLPSEPIDPDLPFLFLGGAHLDRWRGHALAALGDPEATMVLTDALQRLDRSFTRAETALHVDLAAAFATAHEFDAARQHIERASHLAVEIGSSRQTRRITELGSGLR